jgi:hypothetical protein
MQSIRIFLDKNKKEKKKKKHTTGVLFLILRFGVDLKVIKPKESNTR